MSQDLRLFRNEYQMDGESLDLLIDDLQFRKLRQAEIGSEVLLDCVYNEKQQPAPHIVPGQNVSTLKSQYAQAMGPGVLLKGIQILEVGEGQKPTEAGIPVKGGTRVVLTARTMALHGWGKAVGYREL